MPTGHSPSMPGAQDPAEAVARVVVEKRYVLLRAYRGWLRPHDLEDCLSQAALELVVRARRAGSGFQSAAHIANALEQKLRSRIYDRQRARSGKSAIETALARALPLEEADGHWSALRTAARTLSDCSRRGSICAASSHSPPV